MARVVQKYVCTRPNLAGTVTTQCDGVDDNVGRFSSTEALMKVQVSKVLATAQAAATPGTFRRGAGGRPRHHESATRRATSFAAGVVRCP